MTEPLKPCPFCGVMPRLYDPPGVSGCRNEHCAAWGANDEFFDVPVEAWNRRAPRFSPEDREALIQGRTALLMLAETERAAIEKPKYAEANEQAAAVILKMLEESTPPT